MNFLINVLVNIMIIFFGQILDQPSRLKFILLYFKVHLRKKRIFKKIFTGNLIELLHFENFDQYHTVVVSLSAQLMRGNCANKDAPTVCPKVAGFFTDLWVVWSIPPVTSSTLTFIFVPKSLNWSAI